MADVKISALPPATTPLAGTEVLPVVQSSTTKKVSIADVTAGRAISASGVTVSGLTASKPVFTDGSKALTSSGTLATDQGGTGLTSYAQGDLVYYNTGTTLTALPKNTSATRYLANSGTSNNPAWAQVDLTNGVTGVLPVANGGTNASSASITAFNNITGYTASGATGTTSTNLVFSTSPSITTPRVITSINDTNGNELFGVTATASAVNELTVANAATGNNPSLSATGSDTNIGITLTPKGSGNLTLTTGNLVVANGNGIDFSATAGTGTSELFADYEEGTWAPTLEAIGGSFTANPTYTSQSGTYTKIGRFVYCNFSMTLSNKGTTTGTPYAGIGGFPFTVGAGVNATGNFYFDALNVNWIQIALQPRASNTNGYLIGSKAAATASVYTSNLANNFPDLTDTTTIAGNFMYAV